MKKTERITINRTPLGHVEFITIETISEEAEGSKVYSEEQIKEYAKTMCLAQKKIIQENLPSFPEKQKYIDEAPFPDFI